VTAIDTNYCFRRNEKIFYKNEGGSPVLIDPYRRTLVELNPTALRIWQLLDGSHSVAAIIEILKNEFEADSQSVDKDVTGLLKELHKREMIQ
jgi:coenzyme PQQ biosynthesis protein PqqD